MQQVFGGHLPGTAAQARLSQQCLLGRVCSWSSGEATEALQLSVLSYFSGFEAGWVELDSVSHCKRCWYGCSMDLEGKLCYNSSFPLSIVAGFH